MLWNGAGFQDCQCGKPLKGRKVPSFHIHWHQAFTCSPYHQIWPSKHLDISFSFFFQVQISFSHLFSHLSTWEEHEEDGRQTGGFLVGLHHIEGQLLDELRPEVIHNELRQRSTDAVRAKHTEQEEAMERRPWGRKMLEQRNDTKGRI